MTVIVFRVFLICVVNCSSGGVFSIVIANFIDNTNNNENNNEYNNYSSRTSNNSNSSIKSYKHNKPNNTKKYSKNNLNKIRLSRKNTKLNLSKNNNIVLNKQFNGDMIFIRQ